MRLILKYKGGTGSGNWGHRGRPGLVGGSSIQSIPLDLFGVRKVTSDDDTTWMKFGAVAENVYPANKNYDLENTLRKEITSSGISEYSLMAYQKSLMFQSAYLSYPGTQIVESVSRVFGIGISDSEKDLIDKQKSLSKRLTKKQINNDYIANGYSVHDRPASDEDVDKMVRAVYEQTQKELAKRGITSVKLYRGSDTVAYSNVLSSYTIDKNLAAKFGNVQEFTVPASKIWSLPYFGWGVNVQLEVIVIDE